MANDIKKLLELRKRMKARQPTFLRKDVLKKGDKNRKNILLEAQKRKITITNVKDIPAEIARIDSEFENRKKEKKGRQEQKTLTKQDLKKKAEQKEKETKAASKTSDTDEEKKKEERLEAEKVMISK